MKKLSFAFVCLLFCHIVYADDIMCDDKQFIANFEPLEYTCDDGEFLPANTPSCAVCPNGYTCTGGTFNFSDTNASGIEFPQRILYGANNICADNFPVNMVALFEPNQYTCSPGYYLPANVDGCTICPANNYCVGGTYTFNETTTQGIESCPVGMFSLAGSSSCTANVITIEWDGAIQSEIDINNAGTATYNSDIRTPRSATHIPGKVFLGWIFSAPIQNE